MNLFFAVCLALHLLGGASAQLRASVDVDAPLHPIVIENLGDADPLLGNLTSIPENASDTGAWSALKFWPIVAIHAAVLPDGKLITYGARPGQAVQDGRTYTFWDPKLGFAPESLNIVPNADRVDSFCSSGVLMLDGTFLVAGGKGFTSSRSVESSLLDYRTQVATRTGNLHFPRWYGTITKLPDGRAIATGGGVAYAIGRYDPAYTADKISPTPEIYTAGDGWRLLEGARSLEAFGSEANGYWYPHQWITAAGTLFGVSTDVMWEMNLEGNGSIAVLGRFKFPPNATSSARPNVAASSSAVMYDTGKIIQMGGNGFANGYPSYSSAEASIIDITGIGGNAIPAARDATITTTANVTSSTTLDVTLHVPFTAAVDASINGTINAIDDFVATDGTATDTATDKAAINVTPTFTATNDIAATPAAVVVTETSPMNFPRQWHNSMVLPNGHVLVTGGTKYALTAGDNTVLDAEIWNPETGNWTLAGKASVFRAYHSVGILLPNGAVYTGGSGIPGPVSHFNAEIYFPPYLFERDANGISVRAKRPKIVSMSTNFLNYGDALQVQVGAGDTIAEISFSALPAVTHSFDSNQRRMTLDFQQSTTGSIVVTMPPSPNLAPPGHYYLNVVNGRGIPSEAVIVGLEAAAPPVPGHTFERQILQVTGAFTLEANVRFDVISGRRWQRIVDFSNGVQSDNIIFGQWGNSPDLFFQVYRGGQAVRINANNVIVEGEMANWKAGVNETGRMWVEKNGVLVAEGQGQVPRNVYRAKMSVGSSNNPVDPRLAGFISGLSIVNHRGYNDGGQLNVPQQITGAFSIKVNAIFNDLSGSRSWQRIIDFGNSGRADNIVLSQHAKWRNIMLEIVRDGQSYRVIVERALTEGELVTWRAGVDLTGLMWIEKNGQRVGEAPGVLPRNILRRDLLIGESSLSASSPLWGSVFGLEIINEAETGVPEQITGPFVAETAARFDNLSRKWQRVFDFGNGPKQDNIILTQFSGTNAMAVEIWRDGLNNRMIAPNAIIEGEQAMWKVGVNASGWMSLEKNGVLLVQQQGVVPRDVYRGNTLFGESNWPNDDSHAGIILGHDVTNNGVVNDGGLLNFPQQISGEFSVDANVRFDDLTGSWQRVFDFGGPPVNTSVAFNNIAFGQSGSSMDVQFEIWSNTGVRYQLIASNVLMEGELAFWQVGVDRTRLMWIAKNGNRLAEGPGILPADVPRERLLVGESNWGRTKLDGVVLGLRVHAQGDGVAEVF